MSQQDHKDKAPFLTCSNVFGGVLTVFDLLVVISRFEASSHLGSSLPIKNRHCAYAFWCRPATAKVDKS